MTLGEYLKQLRKKKSISQRELAESAGISNAEISRIETGERQKPSPDVLRKLAPFLGVTYEDLMDKAGYINERAAFFSESKDAEEKFFAIVTPMLIMDGWGVEPVRRGLMLGDIVANREKEAWHIDFKFIKTRDDDDRNFRDDMNARTILTQTYGRLAIYNKSPITKFTIAVHNEKIFNLLIKFNPIHLNIKVSIMLVDLDNYKIVAEHEF